MNRRGFLAALLAAPFAAFWRPPGMEPQLAFHPKAFALAMEPLRSVAPASSEEMLIVSGGEGYMFAPRPEVIEAMVQDLADRIDAEGVQRCYATAAKDRIAMRYLKEWDIE